MAEEAEVSSPHPRMYRAAELLHLQHQPPLTRRLDAQRRREVHWEWLGGLPMEIRPGFGWIDRSMELIDRFNTRWPLVGLNAQDRAGLRPNASN